MLLLLLQVRWLAKLSDPWVLGGVVCSCLSAAHSPEGAGCNLICILRLSQFHAAAAAAAAGVLAGEAE
jgi:hypothetical protein